MTKHGEKDKGKFGSWLERFIFKFRYEPSVEWFEPTVTYMTNTVLKVCNENPNHKLTEEEQAIKSNQWKEWLLDIFQKRSVEIGGFVSKELRVKMMKTMRKTSIQANGNCKEEEVKAKLNDVITNIVSNGKKSSYISNLDEKQGVNINLNL